MYVLSSRHPRSLFRNPLPGAAGAKRITVPLRAGALSLSWRIVRHRCQSGSPACRPQRRAYTSIEPNGGVGEPATVEAAHGPCESSVEATRRGQAVDAQVPFITGQRHRIIEPATYWGVQHHRYVGPVVGLGKAVNNNHVFSIAYEKTGGGGGIRTRDTVSRIHTFQACAFDRSATPPRRAFSREQRAYHLARLARKSARRVGARLIAAWTGRGALRKTRPLEPRAGLRRVPIFASLRRPGPARRRLRRRGHRRREFACRPTSHVDDHG